MIKPVKVSILFNTTNEIKDVAKYMGYAYTPQRISGNRVSFGHHIQNPVKHLRSKLTLFAKSSIFDV